MARGRKRASEVDAGGIPVDGRDWTEADWADLHHGVTAIRARIAARHRAMRADKQSEEKEAPCRSDEPSSQPRGEGERLRDVLPWVS